MLREVCVSGTAASASKLRRKDLAGKTGTTDDCTDAWFVGFSPTYTTGVWLGFDAKVSLGRREYGSTAALPVWMDFMKEALGKAPSREYPVPPGIAFPAGFIAYGRPAGDAILQADWDPFLGLPLKEVCPVDTVPVPAAGNWYAAGGLAIEPAFNAMAAPGEVRVLSPTGQSLGLAYLSRDEKGKIALYRDNAHMEGEPDRSSPPQESAADWFLPRAGQILRQLRQFVPPSSYGGWFQ
jgi:penicillin-binding protein 1A